MYRMYKFEKRFLRVGVYLLLICGVVVTGMPFVWEFSSSLKLNSEIFSYPLTLIPRNFTFSNYVRLVSGEQIPFLRQLLNSCIVSASFTALALFICSIVGYGFAKFQFCLKGPLFIMVLITMMVPQQVLLVPLFLLMNRFYWLNTYLAVIIPGAFNAFGVFFMRQIMVSIPDELIDSARIDGASEFGIYWKIVLPLSSTGMAVLAIILFLTSWNDYLWPLIALRTEEMFTLPVGLATLLGLYKVEYGMIMAGGFLATLPVIALFISRHRQFITGMTSGAFKF